ncbi:hypothetical protein RJ639_014166 [Escallonia herrerae]|uniref:Reverse transcriptase RNase H-like domain-containing protein n=1 Tax=Escallonia herrerae TaxID=1293975 RepID=A0AA88VH15_9ASTE|nr:hypothetical protein RJ639_014166 [Escallonia herrerae]
MGDVKDCLRFVEQNLQTLEDHVLEELKWPKKAVTTQDELRTRFMELFTNLQEQLNVVKVCMEEMRQETAMCKKAIAGGAIVTPSPRVNEPKPKEFGGKRDAKELDNFIWHIEHYFERASITDEKAKEAVIEEPILALPDHTKVFEVETDASNFSIGGVLMQEGHPIAFESHKLNDTERKYMMQEKEMIAVVHCLRIWRHYLLGSRFLIKTDNIATSYFQSQKKLSLKQARWQDFLAEFDYACGEVLGATEDHSERSRPKVYEKVLDGVVQTPWLEAVLFNELSPQMDGQTERVNALLECYLWHIVSAYQTDWERLLDVT